MPPPNVKSLTCPTTHRAQLDLHVPLTNRASLDADEGGNPEYYGIGDHAPETRSPDRLWSDFTLNGKDLTWMFIDIWRSRRFLKVYLTNLAAPIAILRLHIVLVEKSVSKTAPRRISQT